MFFLTSYSRGEPHPWAGPVILGLLVGAIWIIALIVKASVVQAREAREDMFARLSRELRIERKHFREEEKPKLHVGDPLGRLYARPCVKEEDLQSLPEGWSHLAFDGAAYVAAAPSTSYLLGTYQDRNIMVGDVFRCAQNDRYQGLENRGEAENAYYLESDDFTAVVTWFDYRQFPKASLTKRRRLIPRGIHAEGYLGSASFNKEFLVQGKDEAQIRAMLTEHFCEWCKAHPTYEIEFFPSGLMLYQPLKLMNGATMRIAVQDAAVLGNLLCGETSDA